MIPCSMNFNGPVEMVGALYRKANNDAETLNKMISDVFDKITHIEVRRIDEGTVSIHYYNKAHQYIVGAYYDLMNPIFRGAPRDWSIRVKPDAIGGKYSDHILYNYYMLTRDVRKEQGLV